MPRRNVSLTRVYAALRRANISLSIPTQSILLTEDNDAGRPSSRHPRLLWDSLTAVRPAQSFVSAGSGFCLWCAWPAFFPFELSLNNCSMIFAIIGAA